MNEPMAPGRILVVDDDRLVLATVVHGLSEAGYVVLDADNGDDAILLAREHRPDLALLDIRMEGMSGFDVAAYLRESLQTPFMFLSAFSDAETTAKVRELGAVAYLVKPLDIQQIVPAVKAAFEQIRAGRPAGSAASLDKGSPQASAPAASASPRPPGERVAMAVGVLMHRYSIGQSEALERLRQGAVRERQDIDAHADAVVKAVEVLAASNRH